jgi:hypothetical protein
MSEAARVVMQNAVAGLEELAASRKPMLTPIRDAAVCDRTCPICMTDVEPLERYILEPCGRWYHQECIADRFVRCNIEQGKAVCCPKPSCDKPACIEDVLVQVGSSKAASKIWHLALMYYAARSQGAVQPCYTEGCRQVGCSHVSTSCQLVEQRLCDDPRHCGAPRML